MLESDRTQLSQDPGGGTLAIDTLPDNRTRVVVSAGGTWKGREVAVGRLPRRPGCTCQRHKSHPLGLALDVSMVRGLPRVGMKAGPSLGHKIFTSRSFIDCLPPRAPREVK